MSGISVGFTATGNYTDGSTRDLTSTAAWTVANDVNTEAVISASGVLTTTGPQGTALVTATLNSRQASTTVVITGGITDVYVQVYQTQVGTGNNGFTFDATGDLPPDGTNDPTEPPTASPSGAWHLTGSQPRGFATWVRAVGKASDASAGFAVLPWTNVSSSVTWSLQDPNGTGTTINPATGQVACGPTPGTVYITATLPSGVKSIPQTGTPRANGQIHVGNATLSSLVINPAANTTPGDPHFGPDPIYVAVGHRVPAKVTGTFTGVDAGGYCITWDSGLTPNNGNASVDSNGVVTGVLQGISTVTGTVAMVISDTIPVNVGAPEVDYLKVTPSTTFVAADGSISTQLTATAYLSDGTATDVTSDPNTTWSVASGSGATVGATGLVTGDGTGTPGNLLEIRACYKSNFIDPTGAPLIGAVTCSNSGDALQTAPPYRDASGNTVNLNSVITLN